MSSKSSIDVLKELTPKLADSFKILKSNDKIKLEESKNADNPSTLNELFIKLPVYMEYGNDYLVISLDNNNIDYVDKLFPYFKQEEISSMDAIVITAKENQIQVIHIEMKSNEFSQKSIYKKYIHSKKCIDFILASTDINSVFSGFNSFIGELEIIHKVLVFSAKNVREGAARFHSYSSNESKKLNDNMQVCKICAKNKKEYQLGKYLQ